MYVLSTSKPRLVFFRWLHPDKANYIRLHLDQHVKCLAQFFDVSVITGDSDYGEVCDKYQPDIALFESGIYASEVPRRITNVLSNPKVPKVGLCNADAMCGTRSLFIADMARWDITTIFGISVSLAEYTPELANRLYVWPNAVDPDLYHDYGERRHIPVLVTGSQAAHYPWRNRIAKRVAQYYPTMTCPHFGWGPEASAWRMISGEQYARLLNASWFAPTCGTVANDLVRKHFEIPGSNACLVTEPTAAVAAAGFVDWENCIHACDRDIVDKLDYLFRHRDEFDKIVSAGYNLVHTRHTIAHRDQLFQWFDLNTRLTPGQRIVQPGPFERLRVVAGTASATAHHLVANGLDRLLLREGDRLLWQTSQYEQAEQYYRRALNYLPYLPEAKLRLAICNLKVGDPLGARRWIEELFRGGDDACDPDPVEWACFLVLLLCEGKLGQATKAVDSYPTLHHLELDRVRQLITALTQHERWRGCGSRLDQRCSVHQLPPQTPSQWLTSMCTLLTACKQDRLAQQCAAIARWEEAQVEAVGHPAGQTIIDDLRRTSSSSPRRDDTEDAARSLLGRHPHLAYLRRARRAVKRLFQYMEKPLRYRLPYRISIAREDECFALIEALARESTITAILIYGAGRTSEHVQACVAGAEGNPNGPPVFLVHSSGTVERFHPSTPVGADTQRPFNRIDTANVIGPTLVVIGGQHITTSVATALPSAASVVVVADIGAPYSFEVYQKLAGQYSGYTLVAHNPLHRGGYAVFRRRRLVPDASPLSAGAVSLQLMEGGTIRSLDRGH